LVVCGSAATAGYVGIVLLPGPAWLLVALTFGFVASLGVGSVAIWQVLTRERPGSSPFAMLAAVSNVVAGALFLTMVLVQLAAKDVQDPPDEQVRAVYWGLDVAWDLYLGAGTLGFAWVFRESADFRWLWLAGAVVGGLLVVLNVAAFPEPPGSAGLVDVGPLVGLWYSAITARAFFMWRTTRRQEVVASR
jgi:hypothetical protein